MGSEIKENYLKMIQTNKIENNYSNKLLPVPAMDRKLLLPTVVKKNEVIILSNSVRLLKKVTKKVVSVIAKVIIKIVKAIISTVTNVVGFIGISAVVIVSTAIITKNLVNSKYGKKPEKVDQAFSIYRVREENENEIKKDTEHINEKIDKK